MLRKISQGPMRRHTLQDLEYDLSLLYQHEVAGISQAALAQMVGMSPGHLSRRLARGRRYREELRKQQEWADRPMGDAEDLLHVPLTVRAVAERGHYYDLDTDLCTVESGRVRVGNQDGAHEVRAYGSSRHAASPLEGQRLRSRAVNGGRLAADPDDPEPESDKAKINSEDKAKGVVYVQH